MDYEALDLVFPHYFLDQLVCPLLACIVIDRNIASFNSEFSGYQSA